MVARELDVLLRKRVCGHFVGLSCLDCRAEFGVDLSRVDRRIGVRINTGSQAQENLLRDATLACEILDGIQLLAVVHYKVANAIRHGVVDVGIGLVVAMEISALHRKTDRDCGTNFTR